MNFRIQLIHTHAHLFLHAWKNSDREFIYTNVGNLINKSALYTQSFIKF